MVETRTALHRTILVVDVEGFSEPSRASVDQRAVRDGLYRTLRTAFENAGLPWDTCLREDRGDGMLILAPPEVPSALFVESLPRALIEAQHRHNTTHREEARIRLRMALHAGDIHQDSYGAVGSSINFAFRLLDSTALKSVLASSPGLLGLVVSPKFFESVVWQSMVSDPESFRRVSVTVKETTTDAWISLPGQPFPAGLGGVVPRQLPAPTPHFVGQREELDALDAALDEGTSTVVISGAPGIGKTALALHWAHKAADMWPDGQLYVNLRGYEPGDHSVDPAEVLRELLRALDVPAERLPDDVGAQTGLYRSLMAGRRALVVLDNARDSQHVTPLLPGSPSCLVLVTSRVALFGLAIREGARQILLDVLSLDEATALLNRLLGQDRIAAEPDAVARLVKSCDHLPLALTITAARATSDPTISLAQLANELSEHQQLFSLGEEEPPAGVTPVVSWAYQALSPAAAQLLRVLGVHAGPEFEVRVTAGLAGLDLPEARALLTELARTRLLDEHVPGRYRFHDLLRDFATDVARFAGDG